MPWKPVTVYDDGAKTVIRFRPEILAQKAPALFVIDLDDRVQALNYRVRGATYVVDGLFDRAALQLGQDRRALVTIERSGIWNDPTTVATTTNHGGARDRHPGGAVMADDPYGEGVPRRPARPRKAAVVMIAAAAIGVFAAGGLLLHAIVGSDAEDAGGAPELATPAADPPPAIVSPGDRAAYFAPPPPPPLPEPNIEAPDAVAAAVTRPAAWSAPIALIPAAEAGGLPRAMARTPAAPPSADQERGVPGRGVPGRGVPGALPASPGALPGQFSPFDLASPLPAMPAPAQPAAAAGPAAAPLAADLETAASAPGAGAPWSDGGSDSGSSGPDRTADRRGAAAGLAGGRNASRLVVPGSRLTLSPGTVVNAVLTTGVNTDLPGAFNARVTRTVWDEVDGAVALLPQGSLITGSVGNDVAYGEKRAFLVARYIRLAGTNHYLDIAGVSAAGLDGTAGIPATVDNHYGRAIGVGVLTALLGTGSAVARAGLDGERDSIEADSIAGAAGELQRVGGQFLQRELRLQPTLTAEAGDEIAFILNRELQFDGGSR